MRAAVVVSVSPAAVCHECTADHVASVIHLHSSAPATPNSVLLSILNSLSFSASTIFERTLRCWVFEVRLGMRLSCPWLLFYNINAIVIQVQVSF